LLAGFGGNDHTMRWGMSFRLQPQPPLEPQQES
jgi:hypothetical protein